MATFLYFICRYESTVAGQFFGHAHPSFYAMVYDDVKFTRPVSVIYVPGSVTTFSNLNPGYRIYTIDGFYENSTWVSCSNCSANCSKSVQETTPWNDLMLDILNLNSL